MSETGVMASRGQVQIDVVADTSKFPQQVQRELEAALRGLKLQPIPVDADTDPMVRKVRAAAAESEKSLKDMFEKIQSQAGKAGAGIGTALGLGIQGALVAAVSPAAQSAVAILASIGPAALAVIPAAVGVLGTMKVALFGVGDALKEVGSDQEKFNEAIEGLSPNARRFARALRVLVPDLKELKNAVQDQFFAGFNKDLKSVAKNLLGPVRSGMTGVAGDLNGVVREFGRLASSAKGAEAVATIFEVTRSVIAQVSDLFGPLLERVGEWIIKAGDSGVNSAFIEAKNTLRLLGEAAANVGSAVGSLFGGLLKDGPAVAASLAEGTKAVKEFLASAQAQELLKTLADTMDRLRAIALEILAVLPSLLPAVNGLATGGFGVLLAVVEKLVGALAPVAESLGGQEALFRNVGAAIAIAYVAIKAYQAAVVVVTAAQIAWTAATVVGSAAMTAATVVINTTRLAVALLGVAFTAAGARATILGAALWSQATAATAAAAGYARVAAAAVAAGAQQAAALAVATAGWVKLGIQQALATVRLAAYVVATNTVKAATIAWTAVQWLLNAAMTANPIGIVIAVIVLLVAAIVLAYQKSETFRSIVDGVFKAIGAAATWLWENALKPLWDGIVAGFNFVANAASNWWRGVQIIFAYVANAATSLHERLIAFFTGLAAGAIARITGLISFVTSLPGRIVGALGNLGSLLYNAGASIVQGLINGIQSMINILRSKLSFITNLIPSWKGPEDKDRQLLQPAGRAIMQGLQTGISDGEHSLRSQLAGITDQIGRTAAPDGISGNVQGSDGASLPMGLGGAGGVRVWPSQRSQELGTLTIQSDGTSYSELLVRELSHAVRVRGGNVQKVMGKSGGGVQ